MLYPYFELRIAMLCFRKMWWIMSWQKATRTLSFTVALIKLSSRSKKCSHSQLEEGDQTGATVSKMDGRWHPNWLVRLIDKAETAIKQDCPLSGEQEKSSTTVRHSLVAAPCSRYHCSHQLLMAHVIRGICSVRRLSDEGSALESMPALVKHLKGTCWLCA